MLNLTLLSALIPEYDRIHEGDNRYLQLRINDFGENFNPSGRYLWVVYRIAGAKTFVSQQYDLSSMSPSSTGSNYSYTVDLKDCVLVAPGKLEVQVVLTNSSDNLLTLMDKYEAGTTNALIIKSRVYEYYIDESLNPSEGIVSDSGGLSQTIKDYLEDLVQEVIEQGFELNIDSALSASSRNPVENRVIKAALDTKLSAAGLDTELSGTSENPVQNKVIKAALDTKLSAAGLDTALSDTSENPVQNKVIKAALDKKLNVTAVQAEFDPVSEYPLQNRTVTLQVQSIVNDLGNKVNKRDVEASLSDTSENPVQNKVIKAAIDAKPSFSDIPTKVSELENDRGYLFNSVMEVRDVVGEIANVGTMTGVMLDLDSSVTMYHKEWTVSKQNSDMADMWEALQTARQAGARINYEAELGSYIPLTYYHPDSYFYYNISANGANVPSSLDITIPEHDKPAILFDYVEDSHDSNIVHFHLYITENRSNSAIRFFEFGTIEDKYAKETYTDTATGERYKLQITNGALVVVPVSTS